MLLVIGFGPTINDAQVIQHALPSCKPQIPLFLNLRPPHPSRQLIGKHKQVSSEASEQAEAEGVEDDEKPAGGSGAAAGAEEGEGSTYRHRLSNVNFINMGRLQRIKCVVDNQVAVDIGANQVGDIATVALLEETDQLLGKNHLFKRSLLLIKVWVGGI